MKLPRLPRLGFKAGPAHHAPLPRAVVAILQPYFPHFDLGTIRIHQGIPGYVVGEPAAFTNGNNIYFAPGIYDPDSPCGIALIAHEVLHAQQFRELGKTRMAGSYLREYFSGRLRRLGHVGAYENISYERAAYALQNRIHADLGGANRTIPTAS